MNLGAVQAGDVVLVDRAGRRFYAIVTGKYQRELQVEPIDRRVTYHQVEGTRRGRDLAQAPAAQRQRRAAA